MTISRFNAGLLLPVALALLACAGRPTTDADVLARQFCAAILKGQEAAAVSMMTTDLQLKVARLKVLDDGWRARNPDQKPPLGDGLRLTAWQDAPGSCTPGARTADRVVLTYTPASAPADAWRDTLILKQVDGELRVADVRYDLESGGSFRAWLDEALQTPG